MYVGRFLVAAPGLGAYRVSSRSFPHRRIVSRGDTLTVAPTPDAPETDNPYVSYNCVRLVGGSGNGDSDGGDDRDGGEVGEARPDGPGRAVLGNGSHVDPVAEKLGLGYPARDALATSLLALDYEKDDYDTPRIAAVVGAEAATVGIVRRDALLVRAVDSPHLLATYETDAPEPVAFDAATADGAAEAVYAMDYEHPVCAAGVVRADAGWETAVWNGE